MFHKITLRYGCQRTHTQQRDVSKRSPDSRANSTSCLEKLSLSPRNSAQIDRKKLLNLHRDVWSMARSRGSSTKLGRTLLIVPDPRRLSRTRVHTHTHTYTHLHFPRVNYPHVVIYQNHVRRVSASLPRGSNVITRPAHSGTKLYHVANY